VSDREAIVKLRVIAAIAEDTIGKIERREMWPGDLTDDLARIAKTLAEIKEDR
jgi:hypothetical protein